MSKNIRKIIFFSGILDDLLKMMISRRIKVFQKSFCAIFSDISTSVFRLTFTQLLDVRYITKKVVLSAYTVYKKSCSNIFDILML